MLQSSRNSIAVCLLLLAVPSVWFARAVAEWSEYKLFDKADLVVIAVPITTKNTEERCKLPEGFAVAGVETEFEVVSVTKGDKTLKKFVLHHYRLVTEGVPRSPFLLSFDPQQRQEYVLHLRKEPDGRYAPVNGQTDPWLAIYKKSANKPKPRAGDFKSLHWVLEITHQDVETKKITYRATQERWYKKPDLFLSINKSNHRGFETEYRYRRKETSYSFYEGRGGINIFTRNRYPAEDFTRGDFGLNDAYRDSRYKKVGTETVCGHLCDKCANIISPEKDKVWLWRENGLIMRRESVYGPTKYDRATLMISTVTKVEVDIPLEDSLFELPARFKTKDTTNEPTNR